MLPEITPRKIPITSRTGRRVPFSRIISQGVAVAARLGPMSRASGPFRQSRRYHNLGLHIRMQTAEYSNGPVLSKVKLNLSSVSSAGERNAPSRDTTVCTMLSSFSHTTVVPTGTVMVSGLKVKLSMEARVSSGKAVAAQTTPPRPPRTREGCHGNRDMQRSFFLARRQRRRRPE
jgi:hypothetical protein